MQSRDLLRNSPEMHCKIVSLARYDRSSQIVTRVVIGYTYIVASGSSCCFFPSGIKIAFVAIWRVSCSELGYCLKRCTNPELIAKCEHILCMISCELNERANLVPRCYSVTGNVRSGKVRQYTIFHWPLKKENHFKNLRRLCKWYRRKLHVPCHSNKVLRSLLRSTQTVSYTHLTLPTICSV